MDHPPVLPLALFALTYLGLALGRIPGLKLGIPVRFRDHLRVGLPVTLGSLALAVAAMSLW